MKIRGLREGCNGVARIGDWDGSCSDSKLSCCVLWDAAQFLGVVDHFRHCLFGIILNKDVSLSKLNAALWTCYLPILRFTFLGNLKSAAFPNLLAASWVAVKARKNAAKNTNTANAANLAPKADCKHICLAHASTSPQLHGNARGFSSLLN